MSMFPITQKGYNLLQTKLEELKTEFEKMPAIIAHAREKGDLKENAEYHAAREKQGMLNAQIQKVSSDIQNSKVVDPKILPAQSITFGKTVKITDQDSKKKIVHRILGPAEAEYVENAISITSALGKGLLGKTVGTQVTIEVPSGNKNYLIEAISVED